MTVAIIRSVAILIIISAVAVFGQPAEFRPNARFYRSVTIDTTPAAVSPRALIVKDSATSNKMKEWDLDSFLVWLNDTLGIDSVALSDSSRVAGKAYALKHNVRVSNLPYANSDTTFGTTNLTYEPDIYRLLFVGTNPWYSIIDTSSSLSGDLAERGPRLHFMNYSPYSYAYGYTFGLERMRSGSGSPSALNIRRLLSGGFNEGFDYVDYLHLDDSTEQLKLNFNRYIGASSHTWKPVQVCNGGLMVSGMPERPVDTVVGLKNDTLVKMRAASVVVDTSLIALKSLRLKYWRDTLDGGFTFLVPDSQYAGIIHNDADSAGIMRFGWRDATSGPQLFGFGNKYAADYPGAWSFMHGNTQDSVSILTDGMCNSDDYYGYNLRGLSPPGITGRYFLAPTAGGKIDTCKLYYDIDNQKVGGLPIDSAFGAARLGGYNKAYYDTVGDGDKKLLLRQKVPMYYCSTHVQFDSLKLLLGLSVNITICVIDSIKIPRKDTVPSNICVTFAKKGCFVRSTTGYDTLVYLGDICSGPVRVFGDSLCVIGWHGAVFADYWGLSPSTSADNSIPINYALLSGAGTIFINYTGILYTKNPILPKSSTILQGSGRFKTIIRCGSGFNGEALIRNAYTATYNDGGVIGGFIIRNLYIWNDGATYGIWFENYDGTYNAGGARTSSIENCWISTQNSLKKATGIYIKYSWTMSIRDCFFYYQGWGIQLQGYNNNTDIYNCHFGTIARSCIRLAGARATKIEKCYFESGTGGYNGASIFLTDYVMGCSIKGNEFETSTPDIFYSSRDTTYGPVYNGLIDALVINDGNVFNKGAGSVMVVDSIRSYLQGSFENNEIVYAGSMTPAVGIPYSGDSVQIFKISTTSIGDLSFTINNPAIRNGVYGVQSDEMAYISPPYYNYIIDQRYLGRGKWYLGIATLSYNHTTQDFTFPSYVNVGKMLNIGDSNSYSIPGFIYRTVKTADSGTATTGWGLGIGNPATGLSSAFGSWAYGESNAQGGRLQLACGDSGKIHLIAPKKTQFYFRWPNSYTLDKPNVEWCVGDTLYTGWRDSLATILHVGKNSDSSSFRIYGGKGSSSSYSTVEMGSGKSNRITISSDSLMFNGNAFFNSFLSAIKGIFNIVRVGSGADTVRIDSTGIKLFANSRQWRIIPLNITTAKAPAVNAPDWTTFRTNLGLYTFDEGDYLYGESNMMPTDWSEGDSIGLTVKYITRSVDGTDRYVRFVWRFSWGDIGDTMSQEDSLVIQDTIVANTPASTLRHCHFAKMAGTGFHILSLGVWRFDRGYTTSDPSSSPFVVKCLVHYRCDGLGSTGEDSK